MSTRQNYGGYTKDCLRPDAQDQRYKEDKSSQRLKFAEQPLVLDYAVHCLIFPKHTSDDYLGITSKHVK